MNSFRDAIQSGRGLHPKDPVVREKKDRGANEDDLESVKIPRSEVRSANHRDNDRHRLTGEAATARHNGRTNAVTIINLSGGGAMIEADFAPNLWDRVDLALGDGPAIECAVRWIRDQRIGLEFAHETQIKCDPEARDAILLDVIRRSFPDMRETPLRAPQPDVEAEPVTDQTGKRAETRHPLIWSGEIHYDYESTRVRLRNISASGALLDCHASIPADAEVLLDLGNAGQIFAKVSWARGDQVGLHFEKPYDLSRLAKAVPEIAPHHWNTPDYLRANHDADSPWAEQWERASLPDLKDSLEGFLKR